MQFHVGSVISAIAIVISYISYYIVHLCNSLHNKMHVDLITITCIEFGVEGLGAEA